MQIEFCFLMIFNFPNRNIKLSSTSLLFTFLLVLRFFFFINFSWLNKYYVYGKNNNLLFTGSRNNILVLKTFRRLKWNHNAYTYGKSCRLHNGLFYIILVCLIDQKLATEFLGGKIWLVYMMAEGKLMMHFIHMSKCWL